jgi:hypothetical protein
MMDLLDLWSATTRQSWPTSFPLHKLTQFDDLIISSNQPGEPGPFQRLFPIWLQIMLGRIREVAPSIPDWDTAFAQEHPAWATNL